MRTLRLFLALAGFATAQAAVELPDLPDPKGRAGMMAAVLKDGAGQEVILAAGGSNFPGKMPWEGGTKVFYKDIFLLKQTDGKWSWRKVGELPTPNAYAAFAATPARDGLVIAGGCNAEGHLSAVLVARTDGTCAPQKAGMDRQRAYAGFFTGGTCLYVLGGTNQPNSTSAEETRAFLDLRKMDAWVAVGSDDYERILPLTGAGIDGTRIWAGGCTLSDHQGQPMRSYDDTLYYSKPNGVDRGTKLHALPSPLAAAAGPGVGAGHHLFFVGGDNGKHYGQPPATHPGQGTQVIAIDTETLEVQVVGRWPHPVATAPLLRLGDDLVTISGETRPGVRTPACGSWTIPAKYR
jgi:hypothetical protein